MKLCDNTWAVPGVAPDDGLTGGDPHHPNCLMKRPAYFVRVNGLAASRDMSHNKALKAADQAHAARPDAVIELVQVNPENGKEVGHFKLYSEA